MSVALRFRGEVFVIGFDDIPAASLASPSLSTVRQKMSEMGTLAAEHVLALIESRGDGRPGVTRLIEPMIVSRDSTAALPNVPSSDDPQAIRASRSKAQ